MKETLFHSDEKLAAARSVPLLLGKKQLSRLLKEFSPRLMLYADMPCMCIGCVCTCVYVFFAIIRRPVLTEEDLYRIAFCEPVQLLT